jgi:hypothetical protein
MSRRIVIASILLVGCQSNECEPFREIEPPDVPLVRQTEHLDIHSDSFVCAGTAVEFEHQVTFVAEQFDLSLRTGIPVFLYEGPPEVCGGWPWGCFNDGAVFTRPWSSHHELNHAVACQIDPNPRAAIVEGLAVMFEPHPATRILDDDDTLVELLEKTGSEDLNYGNAGHFARWLFEREGPAAFAELYTSPARLQATIDALEDIYGSSLDDLQAEYLATAPHAWVPFRQCADVPHIERHDDGVWRYSGFMDCEDEATFGPYVGRSTDDYEAWQLMYQSFTFTLEDDAVLAYDVHGEASRVLLQRCGDRAPQNAAERGQVFDETSFPFSTTPGIPNHVTLGAGTWRADVLRNHGAPAPVGIEFWVP